MQSQGKLERGLDSVKKTEDKTWLLHEPDSNHQGMTESPGFPKPESKRGVCELRPHGLSARVPWSAEHS